MKSVDDVLGFLQTLADRRRFHSLDFYEPYEKQAEFHAAGATHRERLLRAGNQEGKTYAGAAETSYHLLGDYPPWWRGRRFNKATVGWCAGVTGVLVRDGPQRLLCGAPGVSDAFGTGFIPRDRFNDKPSLARGVTDAYDTIQVKHVSGNISTLTFKSFEQGRPKFQSGTLDFGWLDEEPPADVYSECLARITATAGFLFITFTPLSGMSTVVARFLTEASPDRADIVMTIYDAKHISPEERAKIIAGYPAHEREARTMGTPMMGTGRIFMIADDTITEDDLTYIPEHWTKLWGIDFGIGHPFAAVLHAWDRDADVIHILKSHRVKDKLPIQHVQAMRAVAANVPVAWPQDGTQRRDDGKPMSSHYKKHGLLMLPGHAKWDDGSNSTEAGVLEMQSRMESQRFKVARSLMIGNWGDEFRNYHRDDKGLIVKTMDDLMSATRVGVMDKRHGKPVPILGDEGVGHVARFRGSQTEIAQGVDFDLWG
jgi:phage terminase large subunit-like protein